MSDLIPFRCYMRDAKNHTRAIEINSLSLDNALTYVRMSKHELAEALGIPLKPRSPVLILLKGGAV